MLHLENLNKLLRKWCSAVFPYLLSMGQIIIIFQWSQTCHKVFSFPITVIISPINAIQCILIILIN